MEYKISENRVEFSGVLDENSDKNSISRAIELIEDEQVELDFSKVLYANSVGIMTWVKIIEQSKHVFAYVNAPYWLVKLFNMISQLIDNKHTVVSLQVPFYCEELNHELSKTYFIGKDIPILDSYESYNLAPVTHNGHEYQPEILSTDYFEFIARNKEALKSSQSA